MKRYAVLVMTTGRLTSAGSDTRASVSRNVERGQNNGGNCFGRVSREAGHSRVPATAQMISGIIRRFIGPSNFQRQTIVVAMPCHEAANAVFDRGLRPEPDLISQIVDIGEGFQDVSGLHRQHLLYRLTSQLLLQNRYDMHEAFRPVFADVVNPRRPALAGRLSA